VCSWFWCLSVVKVWLVGIDVQLVLVSSSCEGIVGRY
jgi:hypothetical protein